MPSSQLEQQMQQIIIQIGILKQMLAKNYHLLLVVLLKKLASHLMAKSALEPPLHQQLSMQLEQLEQPVLLLHNQNI